MISVIIPTYKPQAYLQDCLDSVIRQSLRKSDYEVILVLNGEREPYEEEIQKYINAHQDIKWKFIYTPIPGVSMARNIALNASKGDYITFIDDDDFVSPRYLEKLLERADEDTVTLCYPIGFSENNSTETYPYHITNSYNKLSSKLYCSVFQARAFFSGPVYKLIHKNIIKDCLYDTRFKNGEDSLFMFLISKNIKRVCFADKDAVYYRRFRTGSASLKKRTIGDHLYSNYIQLLTYLKYYFKNPLQYNLPFFLTRCFGCLYDMIHSVFAR